MSREIHYNEAHGDDALSAALCSPDNRERIMGRAVASAWMQGQHDWIQDELHRATANREELARDFIYAFATLQVQLFGSLISSLCDPKGDQAAIDGFVELARNELTDHLRRVRKKTGAKS